MSAKMSKILSVVLSVVFLSVLPFAEASNCFHLWPYNPKIAVGDSLVMQCSVSAECSLSSVDLEFSISIDEEVIPVERQWLTILNESLVQMTFPDVPLSFHRADIFCMQRNDSRNDEQLDRNGMDSFDSQRLSVGYRPFMPMIKKDYKVYNWDYFEFQWTVDDSDRVYHTIYDTWFKRSFDNEFINCNDSPKLSSVRGRTCRVLHALDFVHPNGMLFFKVNGSNAIGAVDTPVERVDLNHIIQPAQMRNISVVSSVEDGVNVTFHAPKRSKRLKYNISINCGAAASWNVSTSRQGSPSWLKISLPFPPFTKCSLSISCLPFHNRQYWSEFSRPVSFTTPDAVALKGPDICCIEIKSENSAFRTIVIYFKQLKKDEARGKVVMYHYHLMSSRSEHMIDVAKSLHPTESSFNLELHKDADSTIEIAAETRAGWNRSIVSTVLIPTQENVLPHHRNVSAILIRSKVMRVSWSKADEGFGSQVVWCKVSSSGCENSVDWNQTGSSSLDIVLPHDAVYRFGVVTISSDGDRKSGIKWIECIYNINEVASVPVVSLFNKTSRSICLLFKRPSDCSKGDRGLIYEYRIEYQNDEKIVNVTRRSFDRDSIDEWLVTIDGLVPESNYSFSVVAMTVKGPSAAFVLSEFTNSSGGLTRNQCILIAVGALFGLLFIIVGLYTLCKWNRRLILKVRRWFNIDVKFPNASTMDDRGIADGTNLSSSYASLSKKDAALESQDTFGIKTEESVVKETSFFGNLNEENQITAENSSVPGNSFQKRVDSNLGDASSGRPGRPTVDISGGGETFEETARLLGCRSGISDGSRQFVETEPRSVAGAEQTGTAPRNGETNDSLEGNNLISNDDDHEIDEIDDYSNVRTTFDISGRDGTSVSSDSYARARLPSSDETEDDSGGRDYSRAVFIDDNFGNFPGSDEPPISIDASLSNDEDDRRDDVNYSMASMIRRSNP